MDRPIEFLQVSHKRGPIEPDMTQAHHHSHYELYFYLGDEMSYFIEDKTFILHQYDLVFIPPYTYHKTKLPQNGQWERIVVQFDSQVLDHLEDPEVRRQVEQLFSMKDLSLPKECTAFLAESFKGRLLKAFSTSSVPAGRIKTRLILLELLITLAEWVEEGLAVSGIPNSSAAKELRIYAVIEHINRNFTSDIKLDDLAAEFFMDKYHLCHLFKEVTGVSIIDYVNRKRLIEAEKLLRSSDRSITEISGVVGFNHVSYFIRLFHKKNGYTPNALKKETRFNAAPG